MLQARMMKPREIVVERVEKPAVTPGHVLLRIGEIGICGSDIRSSPIVSNSLITIELID